MNINIISYLGSILIHGSIAAVVIGGGVFDGPLSHSPVPVIKVIFEDLSEKPSPTVAEKIIQKPPAAKRQVVSEDQPCHKIKSHPVTQSPRYRGYENPLPHYPFVARKHGQQGSVILEVSISDQGKSSGVVISTSSGHASLDQAAMRAIEKWKFDPAIRNGVPVADRLILTFHFHLSGIKID